MTSATNTGPTEPLWTPDDVADFLKVSRSWVYQQAERGVLPCLRFCRRLRFDPRAIRRFVTGKPLEILPGR